MTLAPGTAFASYRIIEPLGKGGMAAVYKAYEAALDRYVAVKVLPAEFLHDPSFAERFQREAKVIARLEHPNIIPIYAYGIDEQQRIPWMAMRLIPGGALSAIVRGTSRRVPFGRSLAILSGVAEALDYAHDKGVVHRDVKPQNILLDEAERVYLADFGIAKMVESSAGLTQTGMITGTPQYMAPEQATAASVDRRADTYALGIVAFEMFTGRVPFTADTPVAILMKHVSEPLPLPPGGEVPEGLMRAILKATAKRPEDRWETSSGFVRALRQGLQEAATSGALAPTAPGRTPPAVTHAQARTSAGPTAAARATVAAPETHVPGGQPTYPPAPPTRPPGPPTAPAYPARAPSSSTGPLLLALGAVFGLMVVVGGGVLLWYLTREPVPSPGPIALVSPTPPPLPSPVPSPTPPEPTPLPSPPPEPPTPLPTPPLPSPPPRPSPVPSYTPRPIPTPTRPPTAPPDTTPTPPPRLPEPALSPQARALVDALSRGGSADERWRAAEALGNLGSEAKGAVPALVVALRDRNDQVRWRAAEALGKLGADAAPAVPALTDALDRSDLLSQEAAKALGRMGAAARPAVPALAAALTRSDVYLRREVAKALVKLGPEARDAVPTLIEALQDKDKTVRAESCRVLGRIGPAARPAVPALQAATRDPDDVVRNQASAALKAIGQ